MASRKDFLKLARDRFRMANEAENSQRERELADLRFYAGEQWDKDLLDTRKGQSLGSGSNQQVVPARPSLTINKTREPVAQVLNQERQSEMGIELVPADDWGGLTGPIAHTEIELREGLVRRIQRDSESADARTWAFSRAAIAGRGYWLVMTRYVPGKTADQEVYVQRIYNQASVTLDPTHEQPDGSDCEWGFIGTDLSLDQYKAEYPLRNGKKNRLTAADFSDNNWRSLGDDAPDWFTTDDTSKMRFVRVVDYYYTVRTTRELAMFEDGRAEWLDELPDELREQPYTTRHVVTKSIKWAKIDGCDDDVLDETDWPGHYLPIIKVVGEELQPYDKERRCEGIVRPMMDPCRGNNYIVSKFVERVGLTPIPPIVMAGGQDEGYEAEWDAANTRTLSRLHYNQMDSFGRPAPPPFKPDARAEIGDLAMGVQMFQDAIVSTSRVPETALGHVDPSVKSGKLAKALIQQSEQGTSNYLDNLKRSIRHEARVINDLLYPIYGRPGRMARLMDPSGKMNSVLIGQPFVQQGDGPQARPVPVPEGQAPPQGQEVKNYVLTPDAEFNVAVKVTRNSDTRRQQITEMIGQIISADPQQMGIIGDLLWKYADAPEHEELEKRYRVMLAPPVQASLQGDQPLPPEVQQRMQQMEQQLQQAMEMADKNKSDLMKAQMQQQGESQRAQMQAQVDLQLEQMRLQNALTIATLSANSKASAELVGHQVARDEQLIGHDHELRVQAIDHEHEAQQAERSAVNAADQMTAQQAHDAEMSERSAQEAE